MEQTKLYKNEHIEYLKPNFGLVVSPAHTFGTDAVLLAHFAAPKKNTLACDMGRSEERRGYGVRHYSHVVVP